MDRNSATGLILIIAITIGYFAFMSTREVPVPTQTRVTEPVENAQTGDSNFQSPIQPSEATALSDLPASDSLRQLAMKDMYSDWYPLTQGEESLVEIKTDLLTLRVNTRGGSIAKAYLNEYKTFDSLPLPLIDDPRDQFFVEIPYRSRSIRTDDLYFTPSAKSLTLTGSDSATLTLRAAIDGGRYIEQVYTFRGDAYDVGYAYKMVGLKEFMGNQSFYELFWTSYLPKTELSVSNMRQKTTIAYRNSGSVDDLGYGETEEENLQTPVDWVSFKSQFFSTILIADKPFRQGKLVKYFDEGVDSVNAVMNAKLTRDMRKGEEVVDNYRFYLGPNEYTTLTSYKLDLQKEMDLGYFGINFINIGTTYIFKFLERFISNYGIIVIILAILIRMLVLPFTYKSYVSMGKMRVLNNTPEMKALDEKYKGDAQKLQVEKMAIYREMGVSMLGGCLPMLFSYPFLIALFFFFPQSVELRQQSFLWANDLSTYDSIIRLPFEIPGYGSHVSLFCLLMAISTFVYTLYQQKSQPTAANNQFKYIAYIMPIFLLFFLNKYASGLSLYYLTANLISIAQTNVIRYFVNDEKLLEKMRATQKEIKSKKGKKGSTKTKGRLEKWMESQQKKQQELTKSKQKQSGTSRRDRRN